MSSTVILERPTDDQLLKRWQLACKDDISDVVVIPNVTGQKIERFAEEPSRCADEFGRMKALMADSPYRVFVKITRNTNDIFSIQVDM